MAEEQPKVGKIVPHQDPNFDVQVQAKGDAKKLLRVKNQKEYRSSVSFIGMISWPNGKGVESGTTITFLNKGMFSRINNEKAAVAATEEAVEAAKPPEKTLEQLEEELERGHLPGTPEEERSKVSRRGMRSILRESTIPGTPEEESSRATELAPVTVEAEKPAVEPAVQSGSGTGAKWIIESVRHVITAGKFVTEIEFRKCLIGY
jgi:hypothetical protein